MRSSHSELGLPVLPPVLNQLFAVFPRQYQITLWGTLLPSQSRKLDPPPLGF